MTLPNQLTVLRMALTPVFAAVLTWETAQSTYIAFALFVVASLTDWYDGYIARKRRCITETGKYLDPLADKLLVSTAFGIFAFSLKVMPVWMFVAMVGRDVVITALRGYASTTGKTFETTNLAKWKTAVQMTCIYVLLLLLIAQLNFGAAVLQEIEAWDWVWTMMFIVTIYTLASGVLYLYENRSLLKSLAIAFYRVFVPTNVR